MLKKCQTAKETRFEINYDVFNSSYDATKSLTCLFATIQMDYDFVFHMWMIE